MTPGMGRGGGGMSHAGSWGLRDQRHPLGRGAVRSGASRSLRHSDPLFTEHTAPQGEDQSLKVDATFVPQSVS